MTSAIFRVLYVVLELARSSEALEPAVRAVEARRAIRMIAADLDRAGIDGPATEAIGEAFWPVFETWAIDSACRLASGEPGGA